MIGATATPEMESQICQIFMSLADLGSHAHRYEEKTAEFVSELIVSIRERPVRHRNESATGKGQKIRFWGEGCGKRDRPHGSLGSPCIISRFDVKLVFVFLFCPSSAQTGGLSAAVIPSCLEAYT